MKTPLPDPNGTWLTHRFYLGALGGNSWPEKTHLTHEPPPGNETVTLEAYNRGERP